jgi:hypothetical protein
MPAQLSILGLRSIVIPVVAVIFFTNTFCGVVGGVVSIIEIVS